MDSGISIGINTTEILGSFADFCRIDRQSADRTIENYLLQLRRFLDAIGIHPAQATTQDLREFLSEFQSRSSSTRANILKALKVFYRDFLNMPQVVESFKFPRRTYTPKQVPSKEDLRRFFDALENDRDRAFFLLAASSGLRRNELLNLTIDDLDLENRTIIPKNPHKNSSTKNSWISCFNAEALDYLRRFLENRWTESTATNLWTVGERVFRTVFNRANERAQPRIRITPQVLRFWFANEMSRLGLLDRFIDALQGRTPRSILARHYSDFSIERLKEAYDKANLTVLTYNFPLFLSLEPL